MTRLIECVPNFSEGRDKKIIDAIAAAITSVDGVALLHVDPGKAANRTVMTFVGEPEAVGESAFRSAEAAARLIDLSQHQGAHPRIGALDVCPFVPVKGVTMATCVKLARDTGARIGEELGIPVYLYEEAAVDPGRRNLADIRAGEYEGLEQKLTDEVWAPDFGPRIFNPRSGASVIGAREFLIAYNINLNTEDQMLAREIAFKLRERGRYLRNEQGRIIRDEAGVSVSTPGLLKHAKAVGWYIEEYRTCQISMNLTNYKVTPPHVAFEEGRILARDLGVRVTGSEVVGLIPKDALLMAGRYYLKEQGGHVGVPERDLLELAVRSLGLNEFEPFELEKRVIEFMVGGDGPSASATLHGFIDELSRGTPTPGGGSVAALAGALGAALASMVASLTAKPKKYSDRRDSMTKLGVRAQELKEELLKAVDLDKSAYDGVLAAYRLPKKSDEDRTRRALAIQEAMKGAAEVPLSVLSRAVKVLEITRELSLSGHPNAISDTGVAAHTAIAAAGGALYNVFINLKEIDDEDYVQEKKARADELSSRAAALAAEVEGALASFF